MERHERVYYAPPAEQGHRVTRPEHRHSHRRRQEKLAIQLDYAWGVWKNVKDQVQEIFEEKDKFFPCALYHGSPGMITHFSAANRYHETLTDLRDFEKSLSCDCRITFDDPDIETSDPFVQEFNGVAVADLIDMEVDPKTKKLALEDIQTINKLFGKKPLRRNSKEHENLLRNLTFFAIQQWVEPEVYRGVPLALEPLREVLTAYFDYYADLLTSPSLSPEDEGKLIDVIKFASRNLPRGVNLYALARSGVTPSSLVKAYRQRESFTPREIRFMWRQWRKRLLEPELTHGFKKDGLPQNLFPGQFFNEEQDKKAIEVLIGLYKDRRTPDEEQFAVHDDANVIRAILKGHQRRLIRDIFHSPTRQIAFLPDDTSVIQGITLTAQNKNVLIIMIHIPEAHLVIELDQHGRMWGVPPELQRRIPHIEDMLLVDFLGPFLKKKGLQPAIASGNIVSGKSSVFEKLAREEREQEETSFDMKKSSKSKLGRLFRAPSESPIPTPVEPVQKRFISYAESRIADLLGDMSSPDTVDTIVETLRRFEYGQLRAKTVNEENGIYRLKSGNHHIFLKRYGSGTFFLERIMQATSAPHEKENKDAVIASQEDEKPKYKISRLKKSMDKSESYIIEKFDSEEYIRRRARKIAPSDPRMLEDLRSIIKSLQSNPYGENIATFKHRTVTIGHQTYPTLRLDPRKRSDITKTHESTPHLRVTYIIIEKKGEEPQIVLKDIYTHEEYEREYGFDF